MTMSIPPEPPLFVFVSEYLRSQMVDVCMASFSKPWECVMLFSLISMYVLFSLPFACPNWLSWAKYWKPWSSFPRSKMTKCVICKGKTQKFGKFLCQDCHLIKDVVRKFGKQAFLSQLKQSFDLAGTHVRSYVSFPFLIITFWHSSSQQFGNEKCNCRSFHISFSF